MTLNIQNTVIGKVHNTVTYDDVFQYLFYNWVGFLSCTTSCNVAIYSMKSYEFQVDKTFKENLRKSLPMQAERHSQNIVVVLSGIKYVSIDNRAVWYTDTVLQSRGCMYGIQPSSPISNSKIYTESILYYNYYISYKNRRLFSVV